MVQRFLMVSFFGILAIGWCHAGDPGKKELAKLEGTWTLVKMEINGKSLLKKDEPKTTFIIKDGKITSDAKEAPRKGFELSKIIDVSKKPTTVTIPLEGSIKFYGIYEISGDDLRVCGDGVDTAQEKKPEVRRPKEFDSTKGLLLVFRRAKATATGNAVRDAALQEKLDVYVGQLKHGRVQQRREAVDALGRIGERAKGAEAAVPFLEKALESEDFWTRKFAAEALWKLEQEPAAVAAMTADLENKDLAKRLDAAEALGRFGVGAKAAVPALVEALNDANIYMRHRAALSLWQINKHPDAIPTLIEALKYLDSENPAPRASAARALGQIGVDAKVAVPALLEALKDEPWTAWDNSAFHIPVALALWQIDKHPAAVPALIEFLEFKEHEGYRRSEAAHSLQMIGIDAKAAVPVLAELLKDERPVVRQSAIAALSAMGAEAKAAVPALVEAAKGQTRAIIAPPGAAKGYLGLASVRSGLHGEPYLDKMDPGSPAAKAGLMYGDLFIGVNDTKVTRIKEFRVALEKLALKPGDEVTFGIDRGEKQMRIAVTAREWPGPDERVPVAGFGGTRVFAAGLLWKINKHPAAVPALAESLKDPEASMSAAESLYSIGAEAKAARPALIDALESENKWTRVYAAKALCRLDAEAEALPALVEALEELTKKDGGLRWFAARTLWSTKKAPAVLTALLESLKDKEKRVNAAAILWDINRHPAAVPALVEDLKSGGGGYVTLVHIRLEGKAAVAALTDALKDADEDVRNSAAQWLEKIDPEAAKKAGVGTFLKGSGK